MAYRRINRFLLTVLLLSTFETIKSIASDPASRHRDQPFWQYVLREFVFRTISSQRSEDELFTKIQEAPFYGGPLPGASNEENALLSSGNVYRISNERWILCQDDCKECEECAGRRNPTVKWVLRRVRRWTPDGLPKWDLQLTVLSRSDKSSQSDQSPGTKNIWIKRNPVAERSQDRIEEFAGKRTMRNLTKMKRRRSTIKSPGQVPLAFYYPEDHSGITETTDGPSGDPSLIMGIDQYGEKHLIHLVPMSWPVEINEASSYPWGSHPTANYSPRISRKTHPSRLPYDKLIERIMDSLGAHRNFIEAFLSSEKLLPDVSNQFANAYRSYAPVINDDENRFQAGNDDRYRYNAYQPFDSEYQVDDDQQERRYDEYREVNPSLHQDRSARNEQETYGTNMADVERKRRNSGTHFTQSPITSITPVTPIYDYAITSKLLDLASATEFTSSQVNQTLPPASNSR